MAITQTHFSQVNGYILNVLDYMTQSQIDACRGGTAVDVSAAIQSALDDIAARTNLLVWHDLARSITIR